jgi:glutaminyl-peptide cyclotransferase
MHQVTIYGLATVVLVLGWIFSTPTIGTTDYLKPSVVKTYRHDPALFTQGIEFVPGSEHLVIESAGLYGQSTIRSTNITLHRKHYNVVQLDKQYFAEGITIVNDTVYQLTWREHKVILYKLDTLTKIGELNNQFEGWGLCYDKMSGLIALSDGSDLIRFVRKHDFKVMSSIPVKLRNKKTDELQAVQYLNELECVGHEIYANVWMHDVIVIIDIHSGFVKKVLDLSHLKHSVKNTKQSDAVLNGIAITESGRLFVTGKLWDTLYEIKI